MSRQLDLRFDNRANERQPGDAAALARGCREPRPETLSEADDRLLLELALKIDRKGLTAPAILWLESLRPVSFLGSQAMHFASPFVRMLVAGDTFERLAVILEERAHLERLLRHVESLAVFQKAHSK